MAHSLRLSWAVDELRGISRCGESQRFFDRLLSYISQVAFANINAKFEAVAVESLRYCIQNIMCYVILIVDVVEGAKLIVRPRPLSEPHMRPDLESRYYSVGRSNRLIRRLHCTKIAAENSG